MVAIFPLVPVERSLDGQVFHPLSEAALNSLFGTLKDIGHDVRDLTIKIERGETVSINPYTALRPREEPLIWLRLSPTRVANVNVRRDRASLDPAEAVAIAEAEIKRSLEMIQSANRSVQIALCEPVETFERLLVNGLPPEPLPDSRDHEGGR